METAPGRRSLLRFWPLLLLVLFLIGAAAYRDTLNSYAAVGREAPDFTLESLDGTPVTLSQLRGQPVILNFWATWCEWCQYEAPAHQAFLERYGDQVAYMAINLREPPDRIRRYRESFAARGIPLSRTELLDREARVFELYRFTGTPETWVIDAEGRAVRHFIGPTRFEDLVQAVEEAGLSLWHEPAVGWVQAAALEWQEGVSRLWLGGEKGLQSWEEAPRAGGVAGALEDAGTLVRFYALSIGADGRLWAVAEGRGDGKQPGLYSRAGEGHDWRRHLEGERVLGVASGPGGRVYAWTRERGLLRSDDGGESWTAKESPYVPEQPGIPMAVDWHDRDHLLSAGPGGVWRSRDGGESWRQTEVGGPVRAIAFHPQRPGWVYFADGEGLLLSRDGGMRVQRLDGAPQRALVGVGVDGSRGDLVAVAANGDVYRVRTEGGGWQLVAALGDPAPPQRLTRYTGTPGAVL